MEEDSAMEKPEISVVIPVYGVEEYLQACIDSLVNQTFDSMELIFVNDASPDRCLEILEKNRERHPDKIRVIDSKENLCQGGARNLGIRAARGKYIGFCDADDMAGPGMYEQLYHEVEQMHADVAFMQYASVDGVQACCPSGGGYPVDCVGQASAGIAGQGAV